MGLFSIFKGKKRQLPPMPAPVSELRHRDNLSLTSHEERLKPLPMPTFPDMPKPEPSVAEESREIRPLEMPNDNIPEELPSLELAPEMRDVMKEFGEELPEELPELMEDGTPTFIKVDDYSSMLDDLNDIKAKLGEAAESPGKLGDMKSRKNNLFEMFRKNLEDVERKLIYLDKTLFEGG